MQLDKYQAKLIEYDFKEGTAILMDAVAGSKF